MESEEDAVQSLLVLRSKTFNDAPIKARLKSENGRRAFFPAAATKTRPALPAAVASTFFVQPNGYYSIPASDKYSNYQHRSGNNNNSNYRTTNHNNNNRRSATQQNNTHKTQQQKSSTTMTNNSATTSKKTGGKHKNANSVKNNTKTVKQPLLTSMNFPPLPPTEQQPEALRKESEQVIVSKYSYDDVMDIVKGMSNEELILEDGKMDFSTHPVALVAEAHVDLLKNQRTYSIEQAREAMRQGRPIRSDSVGSMDYESMMYGEDYTKEVRADRKKSTASPPVVKQQSPRPAPPAVIPAKELSIPVLTKVIQEDNRKQIEPQQEPQPKKSGYAAALMHGSTAPTSGAKTANAPTTPIKKKNISVPKTTPGSGKKVEKAAEAAKSTPSTQQQQHAGKNSNKENEKNIEKETTPSPWGSKRSFVDVLRTKVEVNETTPATTTSTN